MEAEYDQMAEEYDATRDAPTDEEVRAMAASLEGGGSSKTVLDVGVGTGRFAKPISELGFEVTGVDVSRRMLLKARQKGMERLLLGDAYSLPFRDEAFDATMIVHVLHVVADWARVMREIGRVTRGNVVTILRVREAQVPGPRTNPVHEGARGAAAGAYPVRTEHRMYQNEQELKSRVPPVKLQRVRDEIVSIPIAEAFRRLEAKRAVAAQMMPPDVRRQMMERIIEMRGGQAVQRRIVEDLAVWTAEQLRQLTPETH